jgi:hypothetical protein
VQPALLLFAPFLKQRSYVPRLRMTRFHTQKTMRPDMKKVTLALWGAVGAAMMLAAIYAAFE